MKRLSLIFVLCFVVSTSHAQVILSLLFGDQLNTGRVEFGLDGGMNLATLSGIAGAENLAAWNLGFYFDIKLNNPSWMVHTGVIVKSTLGADDLPVYPLNDRNLDSAFKGGSVRTTLQHFDVPVMLKYKFDNNVFLEGGVVAGLLYGATDEFRNSVQGKDDLKFDRDVKNDYHPLDAGIMFGTGYRLFGAEGINLGIRYYYGLVDISVDDSGPGIYNRAVYFTVGVPIGAASEK